MHLSQYKWVLSWCSVRGSKLHVQTIINTLTFLTFSYTNPDHNYKNMIYHNYKIFFQIFHLVDMGLLWNKLKTLIGKSRHFTMYIRLFMFSIWLNLCDKVLLNVLNDVQLNFIIVSCFIQYSFIHSYKCNNHIYFGFLALF